MAGEAKTFTQEEFDAMIAERLSTEVAGLKANQAEALKEAKAAKAALKNYDGIDPEEYKALKAAAAEAEEKRAAAAGDFETLKKQMIEAGAKKEKTLIDQHTRQLSERDAKEAKLTKSLEKRLVQAELTKAIAAAKGDPDLLLPYAERFVRTRETDDDFEAFVVDGSGNARVADGKGTPMTFDMFVEQDLMQKFPRAFDGTGSSGGGASKSTGGAGGAKNIPAGTAWGKDDIAKIASGAITVPTT